MKDYSFHLNFLLLYGMNSNADYILEFAASRETENAAENVRASRVRPKISDKTKRGVYRRNGEES